MSFSLLASQGLSALSANIMVFGIAALYGDAVLGHYSMAVRLVGLPVALIASAMGDVYRQRAAELYRREGRFQRLMAKTVVVMACIGVPGFTIAGLLTPWAVPAILGAEWVETAQFMMILLVSGSIGFISTVVDKAAVITNARRYILTWHIVRFVGSNAVLLVSWSFSLTPIGLVWGVCGLQAFLYLWDLVVEYRLARGTGPGENQENGNAVTIRT
jgi:O-antigen/teichoic acid export membrane protein